MLRLIDSALAISGGKFLSVKFADGSECVAPAEKEYIAPVESGVEAWCVCETRESGGRKFDLLTFWGPKQAFELQTAVPTREQVNAASADAQVPVQVTGGPQIETPLAKPEKPAKEAPVRPAVTFDMRELSIMSQVALKEAVPYAAQKFALGKTKTLDTPQQIVKTARMFLKGMIEMAQDAKDGSL